MGKILVNSKISNGLIGYWPLNGNSNDIIGGHNGSDTNMSYVSGKLGNCGQFNGSSSNIDVPYDPIFNFTDGSNDLPFSISFWIYNSGGNNLQWIVSKRTQNNSWQVAIYDKRFSIALLSNNSNYLANNTSIIIPDNDWMHVVVVYDGSKTNNGLLVYINGEITNTTVENLGTYTGMAIENQFLRFGNSLIGGAYWFNGRLDELAIWDRTLSEYEIRRLYRNNSGQRLA